MAQQLSELGLLGSKAALAEQLAGTVSGGSICLFALALIGHRSGRFRGSVLCAQLFGTSMIGHGVFPMGDPRHGLYGIGFFVVLQPLLFVIELRPRPGRGFERQCELTALLVLGHLWSMLAGVDPHGWQGPSQRLAVIPMFGWFSGAAYLHLRGSDPA